MSQNQIAVVSLDSHSVVFADKKGLNHSRTIEAAIVKGGVALRAVVDAVQEIALRKAANGRYQSAAEIVADVFPKALKGFRLVYGETASPWENKARFAMFIDIAYAQTPAAGKDWTKKQAKHRPLVLALHRLVSPDSYVTGSDDVVENEAGAEQS